MRKLLFALFAHDQQGNRAAADSQNSDQQCQRECVRRLRNMRHRGRCCGSNGLRGCGRCGGSCGCRGSRRLLAGCDCGCRRGLRRVGVRKGHACGHFRKRCLHLAGAIVLHLNCKGVGLVIIAYAFGVALNLRYRVGVGGGGGVTLGGVYRSAQRSPCRWHRW